MDSIKGLVPEIYYDLIARVAAGVPLVAVILSPSLDELEKISNAASFVLLMGLGYIAGHLLTTISAPLNLVFWNRWIVRRFQARSGLTYELPTDSRLRLFDVVYQRIDWAANKDANAGAIMKKMEAGATLSDSLLSAWVIILSYQALGGTVRWSMGLKSWNWFIITLVTLALIGSIYIRRWALIVRQDRILKLLKYPGDAK